MTRTTTASFSAILVLIALSGSACSDRGAGPTTPSPFLPDVLLAGTVYQRTAAGRSPLADVRVEVTDLLEGPYNWMPWFETTTDASGKFAVALPSAFAGRRVIVTARAASHLAQPCGSNPTIAAETTSVAIELVAPGILERPCGAPSIQGVVTVNSGQGARPVADVPVGYSSNGYDGADAYTRTDADGRYSLGNLPAGRGSIYVACAPMLRTEDVEIHDETVANIELGANPPPC